MKWGEDDTPRLVDLDLLGDLAADLKVAARWAAGLTAAERQELERSAGEAADIAERARRRLEDPPHPEGAHDAAS